MRSNSISLLCVLGLSATISGPVYSGLTNPGFETGDLTGWNRIGSVVTSIDAFASGPGAGSYSALLDNDGLFGDPAASAADLATFFGFKTSQLSSLVNDLPIVSGTGISQTFTGNAGDRFSFQWNFLTDEAGSAHNGLLPQESRFQDVSFWSLQPQGGPTELFKLADRYDPALVDSKTVFGKETGFQVVNFFLPYSGTFTIGFGVVNVSDKVVKSGLMIDNATGPSIVVPEPVSITSWFVGIAFLATSVVRSKKRRA